MSELTDDQLDGLFRKSAEEFDTPFESAAWQDMKARLDANDRTVPTSGASQVKNILRWGLPVVLLLLLVGWSVYQPDKFAGLVSVPSVERNPNSTKATTGEDGRLLAAEQPNKEDAHVKSMRTPEQAVTLSKPGIGLDNVTPDRSFVENHTDAVVSRPAKTGVMPNRVTVVKGSGREKSDYPESVSVARKKEVARSLPVELSLDKSRSMGGNGYSATSRKFFQKNRPISSSFRRKRRLNPSDNQISTGSDRGYQQKARLVMDRQRGTNTRIAMSATGSLGSENEFPVCRK